MASVSIRYIVDDVSAAIAFYRDELGFREDLVADPAGNLVELFEPLRPEAGLAADPAV